LVAICCVLVSGLFCGCSAGVGELPAPTQTSYPPGTRFATYEQRGTEGHQAEVEGVLGVKDGCLVLKEGGSDMLLVFPVGKTSFDDRSKTLTLMGHTFAVGSRINLGGGAFSTFGMSAEELATVFSRTELRGCQTQDRWVWTVGSVAA